MSENKILKDNAEVILKNLKDGTLNPKDLAHDTRRIVVDFLNRQEDKTHEEIAELLHVSVRTITRDLDYIEQSYANLFTEIDYKRVVGRLLYKARNLSQKAMKKEDYRLAWTIETGLIDKLMDLGLLKKPPEEMGVKDDSWTEYMTPEEGKQLDDIILNAMERRNRKKIKMLTGKTENEWFSGNNGDERDSGVGTDEQAEG